MSASNKKWNFTSLRLTAGWIQRMVWINIFPLWRLKINIYLKIMNNKYWKQFLQWNDKFPCVLGANRYPASIRSRRGPFRRWP
jgi:hypothetical protein